VAPGPGPSSASIGMDLTGVEVGLGEPSPVGEDGEGQQAVKRQRTQA
jgi:hypothetical protein